MAGHRPPPITPADPYTWRESVLSTRTLSYISQADALGSPGHPPTSPFYSHSRNTSGAHMFRAPTRQGTMDEESEAGLEMARTRRLEDISELPDSVARSRLFSLPREIRDRIYLFSLTARGGECVEWPNRPESRSLDMAPQLLRTCKLVYAEATNLLYMSNRMSFSHPSDANMFVRAISSPIGTTTHLTLDVKAQDIRLWMPYFTSTDPKRSLKADFPNLKDLVIRFKTNKWQHGLPVEANLRHWAEDQRLDELFKGLGHVFFPAEAAELPASTPPTQEDFQRYLEANPDAFPREEGSFKERLLHLHKAHQTFAAKRHPPPPPSVKIICSCRVHHTHFAALTGNIPEVPPIAAAQPPQGAQGGVVGPAAAAVGMIPGMAALQGIFGTGQAPTPQPVQPDEEFRGFSPIDFRGRVMRLTDVPADEHGPVAVVARTVFAKRGKIGMALEISSVEPSGR
ncbi:hypothetical protein WHR41_03571 [Cladosporium halotolerans]|uniref:Uncharacterized protein n=1 Tax=Cladosporium halotolerans TaxID=1052096 RepID=A0AB34KSX0_9PEZI